MSVISIKNYCRTNRVKRAAIRFPHIRLAQSASIWKLFYDMKKNKCFTDLTKPSESTSCTFLVNSIIFFTHTMLFAGVSLHSLVVYGFSMKDKKEEYIFLNKSRFEKYSYYHCKTESDQCRSWFAAFHERVCFRFLFHIFFTIRERLSWASEKFLFLNISNVILYFI